MQINARINQDQNISKDLTLWNQQGSQVLQGQTLVLPVAIRSCMCRRFTCRRRRLVCPS